MGHLDRKINPVQPPTEKRLLREDGSAIARPDDSGTLRYVYEDGSLDTRSKVLERFAKVVLPETVQLVPEPAQMEQASAGPSVLGRLALAEAAA